MVTRAIFKDMIVTDSVYAPSVDPLVLVTKLHFKRNGVEVGYATLYQHGALYCHEDYLPLAVEWLTNEFKHRKWYWSHST